MCFRGQAEDQPRQRVIILVHLPIVCMYARTISHHGESLAIKVEQLKVHGDR